MAEASQRHIARKAVFALLVVGIVTSTSGHYYQKRQQAAQVT